jgi:outer membrane protein assembly factor BamD
MMKFRNIILAVVTVISMSSCKSQFELLLAGNDADAKYKAAFEYFNNKKYNRAATLFESLAALTDGTDRDDTVRFYWGLSNYNFKDYYTAETNFQQFYESYPRSPFASQARFLRLDCLYRSTLRYELDQQPTYKAMSAISEYMLEFPDNENMQVCKDMLVELGERLDKKAYEAAKLYYKMENYLSSRVAFRNVLKDDSENIYREDILYYIAMSSYKYAQMSVPAKQKERYLTFVDDYLNFIGEIPQSHYRKELDNVYRKAQKALGKEVIAADEEMSEKDFAKERRKLLKAEKKAEKK